MILLKLTDVFEIQVHIILKREQMLLDYPLNLKWWNYNWEFKEITKSFTFKYFQKTEGYLEPIQTTKRELFVKIVHSLIPLTILTKCSILDVWLACKNATKSFNKSSCEFNIFSFSYLVKHFFSFYFVYLFLTIFKNDLPVLLYKTYFYSNEYLHKNIHKYCKFLDVAKTKQWCLNILK